MKVNFEVRAMPGDEVCDFCSATPIYASYDCADFVMDTPMGKQVPLDSVSKEAWAACKVCSELVDKEDWEGLLDRSVETFRQKYGTVIPADWLRPELRKVHDLFRRNMRKAS